MTPVLAPNAGGSRTRRQRLLPWLDDAAQRRIETSAVYMTRVGGLGGPAAQSFVLAGVSRLVFHHEGDLHEEDCNRMILMNPEEVGRPRAPQAEATLRRLGGASLDVRGFAERITPDTARIALESCDLAVGAAPTFEERLMLNDAAVATGTPLVDAAMYADEIQILCVKPGSSACLRCLVPEPPPWRDDFPVLAAVSAAAGSFAASLGLRILGGADDVPWGTLLHLDVSTWTLRKGRVPRRRDCPSCSTLLRRGKS